MRIVVFVKEVLDPDAVGNYALAGRLEIGDDGKALRESPHGGPSTEEPPLSLAKEGEGPGEREGRLRPPAPPVIQRPAKDGGD